jgi:hypothetical protein
MLRKVDKLPNARARAALKGAERSLLRMDVQDGVRADRITIVVRAGDATSATHENDNPDKERRKSAIS